MPLWNPHAMTNPYAAGFNAWPLPRAVKIETGPASSAFEYEAQGSRAETAATITHNRGELETTSQQGDLVRFHIQVVTETETYEQEVVTIDSGVGGGTAFIPVLQPQEEAGPGGEFLVYEPYAIEQTPYIPYEDLSQYDYGQGGYVETAPYIDPYQYADPGYYYTPPETSAPYVPPPPDPYQPSYTPEEVYEPEQSQQDIYDQAFQDYLDYIASQEEQIDYYGSGEFV